MTPVEEAQAMFPIFIAWQERKRRKDREWVKSILESWSIVAR